MCLQNSIRHNLSLHSRFEKIQNEGTGKSSWWQINHNASRTTGKSRRRATSMETPKFEKRRGRVKKVVEAIRNGLHPENTPSPSSSISENSDMIPVSPLRGFQFRLVIFYTFLLYPCKIYCVLLIIGLVFYIYWTLVGNKICLPIIIGVITSAFDLCTFCGNENFSTNTKIIMDYY